MPGKASRASKLAGPFSSEKTLATLDRRTRAGRIYKQVMAQLIEHLGGAPSATERLMIESAAIKSVRLHLLSEKLLNGEDVASDHHALAWLESLRRDLQSLGMTKRGGKDDDASLESILAEHRDNSQ